jgi:hypothetical protein
MMATVIRTTKAKVALLLAPCLLLSPVCHYGLVIQFAVDENNGNKHGGIVDLLLGTTALYRFVQQQQHSHPDLKVVGLLRSYL